MTAHQAERRFPRQFVVAMALQLSFAPMQIVSWNMGCGYGHEYRRLHEDAWRYLIDELRPDVALLQEIPLQRPLFASGRGRFFSRGAWGGTLDWGSAVYVPVLDAEELPIVESNLVHVASARVTTHDGAVVVRSVHVSTGAEHEQALRVAPELVGHHGSDDLIVAGDFNAARHFDDHNRRKVYRPFFAAMTERGFYECHWRQHGREVPTFFRRGCEPYQLDHFFVNDALGARTRCEVIDNSEVRRLSDHLPVRLLLHL